VILKYNFLKIIPRITLLSAVILICGCQVKPDETINSFFEAVADKNLNHAATFCTESFRDNFTEIPSALKNFNYSIKNVNWDLQDMYVQTNGMLAKIYVSLEREWPMPARLQALLAVSLVKEKGKWYISSVQSVIPEYIEFTIEPQKTDKYYLFTLVRPRWITEKQINEPLSSFIKKYDKCCYSWLH